MNRQMSEVRATGIGLFGVALLGFLSCTGAQVPDDPLITVSRNVCLSIMFLGAILALASKPRSR